MSNVIQMGELAPVGAIAGQRCQAPGFGCRVETKPLPGLISLLAMTAESPVCPFYF